MAIISVFEAQNAYRRSIMVDSTPVDHPNAAWDSGYRGPKFASSPVVSEDPSSKFAHSGPDFAQIWGASRPKFRFRILGVRKPGIFRFARHPSVSQVLASASFNQTGFIRSSLIGVRRVIELPVDHWSRSCGYRPQPGQLVLAATRRMLPKLIVQHK